MIQKNRKKFSDKAMYLQEKLPLEKFIPAAFIIFLLCIFVLSLFTYKNIERYKEEYDLITHTNEVIKRLNLTYINAVNHQLLNLRYGDSGDSAYLTEYDSLNIITLSLMNELKIMAIYDSHYEDKLIYLDSLILLNIQINDIRDYVNDENQVEIIEKKTGILKEINITIQDLKSIGMNLMSDLKSEAEESNSSLQLFIIVTSLFSFLVIALSLYIFENLIKHKKRAEDLLLKSFEELEDNVKERTLELEESNLKLTEEIKVRERNERFLKIQYEVSQILEESETVEEASKKLLTNICKGIEWNFGMLWLANEKNEFTKPESFWSDKEINMDEYMNFNRSSEAGSKYFGYPDKFYHKGKSKWSKDINNDPDFAGKEEALKMGWISGMGIPVYNGKNVIAIIECFNNKSIEEKKDLLEVLESASRQFGNFIERKRAEENLRISNLQLEDRVKEKTNELSETLSKLLTEISAKEKVQNKIKLFAHAIRSIKDCVFITDLEINTIYINKAFEDTYGYNENELLGREIPILNNKIISKTLKEDILKYTFSSGWRGELITHRNDGTSFPTYLSTSSIKNDDGKSEALVGICQDITEQKINEEIIRKRNSLLNLLNDVIKFTNKTFDYKNAIQYALDKVCEYTEWEVGHCFLINENNDLISSCIWNSDINEKYLPFKEHTSKLIFKAGKGYPGRSMVEGVSNSMRIQELVNLKLFKREDITFKSGLKTGIWVPITLNKNVIGVLEFFKDEEESIDNEIIDCITNIGLEIGSLYEKLDIITKIKENERNLNEAQKIAKVGSWNWDIENNLLAWSDVLFEMYELNKEEFTPSYEGLMKFVHPEDMEKVNSTISKAIEKKSSFNFYHKVFTLSGKEKVMKAQGECILDNEGKVIKMFGTGQDVTEIIKAEEELKKANAKLIETQKELIYKEKLAALGRFASGIAHEIRNPLANINSLAQLISKADFDEKNKKRLEYIITNVDIANDIIKNLLSFASPEDLNCININLKDLLNDILESVEARCKSANIIIQKEFPEEIPIMFMDKLKIESAFLNFISNSIEAMVSGGILKVKISFDKKNEILSILFSDTGIGIKQENLDKILEPFFTTKDNGVGLGMGLAYSTVKIHNGIFDLKSKPGKGTDIEVRFPVNKLNKN